MNAPAWFERQVVKDAARLSDALAAGAAHACAEQVLLGMFLQAAKGDMHAPAVFAPKVADWSFKAALDGSRPLRYATTGEVLADSLDYSNGPSMSEAMGLICAAAKGEAVQEKAQELLERMASVWAHMNAEDE